jgi:hypothetical protein
MMKFIAKQILFIAKVVVIAFVIKFTLYGFLRFWFTKAEHVPTRMNSSLPFCAYYPDEKEPTGLAAVWTEGLPGLWKKEKEIEVIASPANDSLERDSKGYVKIDPADAERLQLELAQKKMSNPMLRRLDDAYFTQDCADSEASYFLSRFFPEIIFWVIGLRYIFTILQWAYNTQKK